MWKTTGPLNVKKRQVPSMWKQFYAKCETSFGQFDDESNGQFGQFSRTGQFFSAFWGWFGSG